MRTIAIALFPNVQALDVVGPLDVFSEANGFLTHDERYSIQLVGAADTPVRASNGMRLVADLAFTSARGPYDLALVAGGPSLPFDQAIDPNLLQWLRLMAETAKRFGSVCTGAFALAAAGLLDGRTATTHWQNAPELARRFPQARIEHDRIYCRDGSLVTSAGVSAGIDLALALLTEDHGAALALVVAKRLVVFAQRQGGQSQFSPFLALSPAENSPMAKVQSHIMAHLRDDVAISRLAQIAGMGARNFARVFLARSGMTPHGFVERARIDAARRLLEGSNLALKAVAYECGFASADRMRLVFAKRLGTTPRQYRERFRVPSGPPEAAQGSAHSLPPASLWPSTEDVSMGILQ